jgi:hypothetical protein
VLANEVGVVLVQFGKGSEPNARCFFREKREPARLAQILHFAKNARSRMTTKLLHFTSDVQPRT